MTDGPVSAAEPYSPQRRTAILLTGTGTDGAYHAGVLRALDEVGVKLDVVAGQGVGVVGALFAAVDGGQRLWDERGFWRGSAVRGFYPWKPSLRLALGALSLAVCLVAVPLALAAAGLIVFPIDFLLKMVGVTSASGLVARYLSLTERLFAPEGLPTWLPRLVLLVLGFAATVLFVKAVLAMHPRRHRGGFWWRLVPAPLVADSIARRCWGALWELMRGATPLAQPSPAELGRRYTEMLGDNIGQPGFRELLVTAHDLDAHRDLICLLVGPGCQEQLVRRATTEEAEARRAEVLNLSGMGRDHLADVVAGALALPLATDAHDIRFASDAFWRGETHRLCDRPAAILRIVEELAALGVEQVIIVSAAPETPGPHALAPGRLDGRGRLGEYLRSSQAATVRDLIHAQKNEGLRIFTISPGYNPVGPFDFGGGFDDRSDRPQPLAELLTRGYEDAYHQFIDPVVAVSGERVGQS